LSGARFAGSASSDLLAPTVVATQMHPPQIIYWMLVALAVASGLLASYQSAGEKGYDWIHKLGFAARSFTRSAGG
jgi:hypothetical protein